ncbi:MAG: DUF1559 domain-containing protein [Fuerstiella sp.]
MLALAVANYHDTYHCFPPAYIADEDGRPMHSWRVLILPFIEESEIYNQYDFSEPWDSQKNLKLLKQRPQTFRLHGGDNKGTHTNYLAVVGPRTMWPFEKTVTYDSVTDGRSETIHFVENVGSNIQWTEPRDLNLETMSMTLVNDPADGISSWLQPPGAATVAGQVISLDVNVPASELRGMLLINDGQGAGESVTALPDGRSRPIKSGRDKP